MSEPRIVTETREAVGHGGMYSASRVRAVINYFDGEIEELRRRIDKASRLGGQMTGMAGRGHPQLWVEYERLMTVLRGEPGFRTYAEIRDEPLPADTEHEDTMAKVRQLTGQKEETE